jgi:hypothetical protein
MALKQLKVRPDSKGRIVLGALAKGVSSYTIIEDKGRLILQPNVEIPAQEKWLWDNKQALKKVEKGLQDSADGRIKSRGDFKKYSENE